MNRETAIVGLMVLALILWLNRRREQVTSIVTPGPVLDWWQVWEYTGGGSV